MGVNILHRQYGVSTDLSAQGDEPSRTIVVEGTGENGIHWAHTLTWRAAQIMWFRLTQLLYPDKAPVVTGLAVTAPLSTTSGITLTTHTEVVRSREGDHYTIVGWVQRSTWRAVMCEDQARRLWTALDQVLYPVGWEGRENKPRR